MLNPITLCIRQWLWFLICLPGWIGFQFALRQPRRAQNRVLRRLIRRNRDTVFGRRHGFASIRSPSDFARQVPLAEYEDFADAIAAVGQGEPFALAAGNPLLLEPTSGSTGAPKLIPVTAAVRREFAAAVQPWIAWLYLAHPSLFLGRQYWAVSPNTPIPAADIPTAVPVGFADDADYLGFAGRWLSRGILAVPGAIRQVADPEWFARLTLLFLLKEKNLRLISVWHPSFLTVLLDSLPRHLPAILAALRTGNLPGDAALPPDLHAQLGRQFQKDLRRFDEIEALNLLSHPESVGRLWPRLRVISCWEGPRSEPALGKIRAHFPQSVIQGKGLMATEGCVTVPTGCGRLRPCAIRSHYLEFLNAGTGEVHPVWDLRQGCDYSVILTTGAGLWRYRLHDQVRVSGWCHATPCLEFVCKDNAVSDLVGEKLDERHAAEALAVAEADTGARPDFAMLAPDESSARCACGYVLLLEFPETAPDAAGLARRWADVVEGELCRNYHYSHARRLGQLGAVRSVLLRNGLQAYRHARESGGARSGTLKIPALAPAAPGQSAWWLSACRTEVAQEVFHYQI
ncbi:MAG: GH3 auxin-responsive promoter family protein [Lentisphaerae bacterium]|nr:GH3 auxin-responsive promoter family protein [Lentisphaerota bacterium]